MNKIEAPDQPTWWGIGHFATGARGSSGPSPDIFTPEHRERVRAALEEAFAKRIVERTVTTA